MIELVYGGSGSGKSEFAETQISSLSLMSKVSKVYLATMKVCDAEMEKKVLRHKRIRRNKGFVTVERQADINLIKDDMEALGLKKFSILLECMSNLVANEMFKDGCVMKENDVVRKITENIEEIVSLSGLQDLIVVSNNIFDDGADYDEASRAYMRALARINCSLSEISDRVTEIVAGIPLGIKMAV